MQKSLSNKDLLHYLKSRNFQAGFMDRLKFHYRPFIAPYIELISLVNEHEKVGDIGFGSGQFSLLLAEYAKPSFVFGVEINDRLVNNATQLFKQHATLDYAFEKFDGVNFPDKIKELDVIFLNDVLHHVPKNNQQQFIADLAKNMKTGARLVIKDINGSSILAYWNKMHDLIFAGEITHEQTSDTTQSWLHQNNLETIALTKKRMYVYPHYTIVAQKR